jgi:hypothetical protein
VLLASRRLLIVSSWRKEIASLGSFMLIFLALSSPPSEPPLVYLSWVWTKRRVHGGRWKEARGFAKTQVEGVALQFLSNFMCIWRFSVRHQSLRECETLGEKEDAQNLKERSEKEALKRKRVVKQGEWLPFSLTSHACVAHMSSRKDVH